MSGVIVGLDEVGRGAWAGEVVAGAVLLNSRNNLRINAVKKDSYLQFRVKGDDILITDSKKMTSKQREIASDWIVKNALSVGIGKASVSKINEKGIVKATNFAFRLAFKRAAKSLPVLPDFVLVDGFFVPKIGVSKKRQKVIIKGDSKEFSIACASIVAKVYRDQKMRDLSFRRGADFEKYQWHTNKGYGTAIHIDAIRKYGITKHHRKLFVRNYI